MSGAEMRELIDRGWGCRQPLLVLYVEPHMVDPGAAHRPGRHRGGDRGAGAPVLRSQQQEMSDHVLAACREFGYLGAISIRDGVNPPEEGCSGSTAAP